MLVVTTNDLPGYRVVKHLGVVRGLTVRSRIYRRQHRGRDSDLLRRQHHSLYAARRAGSPGGLRALIEHAQAIGANAVLAMRYDANEIAAAVTEVLAYGTAVVVEEVNDSGAWGSPATSK